MSCIHGEHEDFCHRCCVSPREVERITRERDALNDSVQAYSRRVAQLEDLRVGFNAEDLQQVTRERDAARADATTLREFITEVRDEVLYPVAHFDGVLGKTAEVLGQATVVLLQGNNDWDQLAEARADLAKVDAVVAEAYGEQTERIEAVRLLALDRDTAEETTSIFRKQLAKAQADLARLRAWAYRADHFPLCPAGSDELDESVPCVCGKRAALLEGTK